MFNNGTGTLEPFHEESDNDYLLTSWTSGTSTQEEDGTYSFSDTSINQESESATISGGGWPYSATASWEWAQDVTQDIPYTIVTTGNNSGQSTTEEGDTPVLSDSGTYVADIGTVHASESMPDIRTRVACFGHWTSCSM